MVSATRMALLLLMILTACAETSVDLHREVPQGWVDDSYDEWWGARLLSTEGNAGVTVRCWIDGRRPGEVDFHYEPFPSENVGYAYSQRWAFFTDGEADLYGSWGLVVTADVYEALTNSEVLIYEMDASKPPYEGALQEVSPKGSRWVGEEVWDHPPPVYFHRVVFDLGTDRSTLVSVLDRCGIVDKEDLMGADAARERIVITPHYVGPTLDGEIPVIEDGDGFEFVVVIDGHEEVIWEAGDPPLTTTEMDAIRDLLTGAGLDIQEETP